MCQSPSSRAGQAGEAPSICLIKGALKQKDGHRVATVVGLSKMTSVWSLHNLPTTAPRANAIVPLRPDAATLAFSAPAPGKACRVRSCLVTPACCCCPRPLAGSFSSPEDKS